MQQQSTIFVGKVIKRLAQLRGGGSALPGLIVEKLDPQFLRRALSQLPQGVVLITGTNGKTTTTKIVTELLKQNGLRVLTNRTGSNFTRGIVAALLGAVDRHGQLDYDIAVLELDEAHALQFVKQVPPDYVLILNVMRDQLDRFGEIDHTAKLLQQVAQSATKAVILNGDDHRVAAIARALKPPIQVHYFGASPVLQQLFINDDELHAKQSGPTHKQIYAVELSSLSEQTAQYHLAGQQYAATLQLRGVYNFLNAAAALTLGNLVLGDKSSAQQLVSGLAHINPAFGRGETLSVQGRELELVLIKNPGGFRLALSSFTQDAAVMIAINDSYADGRDMSWLWDVDFSPLSSSTVAMVSGVRAYDMALRLQYDDIPIGQIEPKVSKALKQFITTTKSHHLRIFCTYSAMLAIRRLLKKYATVEHII